MRSDEPPYRFSPERVEALEQRVLRLREENREARRLLKDAEDTILCNCVTGEDGNHHIDNHCIGQYGYTCGCFAEETIIGIRAFLSDAVVTIDEHQREEEPNDT